MLSDKEVKKQLKLKASKEPEKYYAVEILKQEGFIRKQCKCGTFFWTINQEQETCGDANCSGGFRFIGNTPAKARLDYIDVWKKFSDLFSKWGYTPIKRYPVVARWRADAEFVQASIYDFQPYVVKGEVQPPANPLVVPQFCLRFNDIDNVGITGAHYTGFVMIGQHAFMESEKWDQNKFFLDIYNWLRKGLKLPKEEITFHEDAWAGGGNAGPSMEYFSRGLELGNQVYMIYENTPSGLKELKLKVLDMGMGHERNAWFSLATATSYDAVFPIVVEKLKKITNIDFDEELIKKFLPYSSYLNIDEVQDIDKAWQNVARKIDIDVNKLKKKIQEIAALYSIAEHSRSLLFALNDGALPSNTGGGYNLRVIFRRALSFIDKYKWNIDFAELCNLHAEYLKPLFPELVENLDEISAILEHEKNKYKQSKEKARQIAERIIKEEITEEKLLKLYDSQGITPELIKEEAIKHGKEIKVPEDFYARIAALHEGKKQREEIREAIMDVTGLSTECLYFDNYLLDECKARVTKIKDNYVVLDKTIFYPTSGGQDHDVGTINNIQVIDVIKEGSAVIHKLAEKPTFEEGEEVVCKIDLARRRQLTQHHTATHIVNAAARAILGKHINQAGARKTVEKAHIDLTHYKSLTNNEIKKIEEKANEIVKQALPVISKFMERTEAEQKYSMNIYQGGAVPGKILRIVEIPGIDVEACAGTHLKNTSEAEKIIIIKSSKISDAVIRLEFVAGDAAKKVEEKEKNILEEVAKMLECNIKQVPARAEELFNLWKQIVKKKKQAVFQLKASEEFEGNYPEILKETARRLRTQPDYVINTVKKFLKQIEEVGS